MSSAICLGLAILFAVALVDIRVWIRAAYPTYLIALALLIAVPFLGAENGGARRWLEFGGISFQPAEFMKIAMILAMARYYQWLPARYMSNPLALLTPVAMVCIPVALVVLQPDLGTALLFAVRRRRDPVSGGCELDLFRVRDRRRSERGTFRLERSA